MSASTDTAPAPLEDTDDAGLAIRSVRAFPMVGPVDPPWQIATALYTEMYATFVEVQLENGVTGWGECLVRQAPTSAKSVIEEVFEPILVGQSATRVQALWDEVQYMFRTRGHSRGIVLEALAGVDIAIWDALGRSLGRPISQLLWGAGRSELDCYASSIMVIDEPSTIREAQRLLDAGYRAIKVKIGREPRSDARRVHAVRELVGDDVKIMIDINCIWDVPTVLTFMREARSANMTWVEEPLMPDDLLGYRKLAATHPDIPLAAGEAEFTTAGFREFIDGRILTYFQPDVARAGGVTGMTRIAAFANAHDIPIAPHVGASGGICAAVAIQVAAAIPNFTIYEHMYLPHGLQDVFVGPRIDAVDSRIAVPQGPGLGLEVDPDKIESMKS